MHGRVGGALAHQCAVSRSMYSWMTDRHTGTDGCTELQRNPVCRWDAGSAATVHKYTAVAAMRDHHRCLASTQPWERTLCLGDWYRQPLRMRRAPVRLSVEADIALVAVMIASCSMTLVAILAWGHACEC